MSEHNVSVLCPHIAHAEMHIASTKKPPSVGRQKEASACAIVPVVNSGGGGIRTPGTREGTPVFETGAFNQAPPPHRGVADVLYLPLCPTFRTPGSNYGERAA